MFGAGALADHGHAGTGAAEIAEGLFKHIGADFRDRLLAIGLIRGFNKIGVFIGERSALRRAAALKLFDLVEPEGIGMQACDLPIRPASSLNFLVRHTGHLGAFLIP